MSETAALIELLQQQMKAQQKQHEEQMRMLQDQNEKLLTALTKESNSPSTSVTNFPPFTPFDPNTELWSDYWARFHMFTGAHSIPPNKTEQVFLTNQTSVIYKLLSNYAKQLSPSTSINELSMKQITEYMKEQFDPTIYIVCERHKFWSDMTRKPGETIHELAAQIRQDGVTCEFAAIKDPQDKALRTRFLCSVNNEAVLKATFRVKDEELTFAKAVAIANETEDASRVAKETVYGPTKSEIHKIHDSNHSTKSTAQNSTPKKTTCTGSTKFPSPKDTCWRCDKTTHTAEECSQSSSICDYCQNTGHIEAACLLKRRGLPKTVRVIFSKPHSSVDTVKVISSTPKVTQPLILNGCPYLFEVDTVAGDNFCSEVVWTRLGKPQLAAAHCRYEGATGDPLPVQGTFKITTHLPHQPDNSQTLQFTVVTNNQLNLLGHDAIHKLHLDVTALMDINVLNSPSTVNAVFDNLTTDETLQAACTKLCEEFPDVFKPELGCLRDFELEMKFKEDSKPIFCKPRVVPFAIQEDLTQAYDAGIKRGIWKPTNFNAYGTPVVPIRKALLPGQPKAKLRVCGDYSATVNPQLDDHRQPVPLPEDLMRKLQRGYGFIKIDLTDAYSQVQLAPESQKRLALSTHRSVLLQCRLPFGIKSAPGYFQ